MSDTLSERVESVDIAHPDVDLSDLSDRELRRIAWYPVPRSYEPFDTRAALAATAVDSDVAEDCLDTLARPCLGGYGARLRAAVSLRLAALSPDQRARAESILCRYVAGRELPKPVIYGARALNFVWRFIVTESVAFVFARTLLHLLRLGSQGYVDSGLLDGLEMLIAVVIGLSLLAVPVLSLSIDIRKQRRLARACAVTLGRWGGPESIETLAATVSESDLWKDARPALRKVLERLRPEDYGRVSAPALNKLTNLFRAGFDPQELIIWVPLLLDSLEKTGTGACAAAVENVVKNGKRPEWREHAARVLPVLLARQQLERDSSRLLRPSEGVIGDGSLLRPVAAMREAADEALLRAAADDS